MSSNPELSYGNIKTNKNSHISIDEYMGQKLKDFRERIGLTLIECAHRVGVSHQQIHKYETGQTKISPGMLYKFCKLFAITPNIFFEGYANPDEECDLDQDDITSYSHLKKINVLLVEDNSEEQFLINRILSEYDFNINVFCIYDGEEFLNIIKRKINIMRVPSPDLIFLDLNIPKLDGVATLKSLKQSKELHHIPVIILTGSTRVQDVMNAYKNYASGYIRKSFDYETLKKNIHLAISYWTEAVILPTQITSRSLDVKGGVATP